MMILSEYICQKLRDLYDKGDWCTHADFGHFLGVHPSQATRILNGKRDSFTLEEVLRLCDLFHKPLTFFIPEDRVQLVCECENCLEMNAKPDNTRIPILGVVGGPDFSIVEGDMGTLELPSIILPETHRTANLKAYKVDMDGLQLGNSRVVPKGGWLIVRPFSNDFPEQSVKPGQFVLLRSPKGLFLKQIHRSQEGYYLSDPDKGLDSEILFTKPGSRQYRLVGLVVGTYGDAP